MRMENGLRDNHDLLGIKSGGMVELWAVKDGLNHTLD